MPAALYRLVRLAWRYRRVIAIALTLVAGLIERHRHRLPGPLQKLDLSRVPGVKSPAGTRDADAATRG